MKKVLVQFDLPGMTTKQYDQVWRDLKAIEQSNPKGLLHHFGAPTTNGFKVVDVWESEDRFNAFGKTLMPILEKNKAPKTAPKITPLHYEYNSNLVIH